MPRYKKNFWVYENYFNKHAFIHVPWCSHCNDGKGQNKNRELSGGNYKWKGCNNYNEALQILEQYKNEYLKGKPEGYKREMARDCGICKPGNNRFWYQD